MYETVVESCGNGGFSTYCNGGDSSEEELAVLPRHTKVVVTGNNRTKSVLVGLQGVVKKAVGLGGWHWLNPDSERWPSFCKGEGQCFHRWIEHFVHPEIDVTASRDRCVRISSRDAQNAQSNGENTGPLLCKKRATSLNPDSDVDINVIISGSKFLVTPVLTNGIEVKLQRNALSVLEAPTGLEDDDDLECENMQWNGSDMAASDDTQKSHRPRHRRHRPAGSSQKTLSRSFSCDSHSKGSVSPALPPMKVDLSKLELKALWRYWRHFNLMDVVQDPTKEQLIDVVRRHFMSQQLDELQVIVGFAKAAKRLKTLTSRHKRF